MSTYEKSLQVMDELFARDCQFSLATTSGNTPSVRVIDTFYDDGSLYIVTYRLSNKVQEMLGNPQVALCNQLYRFRGVAVDAGHPLQPENREIREKLTQAFAPWYFKHNNENDENMCYIRVKLTEGFFFKDGTGYAVDFTAGEAKEFPFTSDIVAE
jgi:uncharacterized pyridoxamine 5'-phosphate oxidase family protein